MPEEHGSGNRARDAAADVLAHPREIEAVAQLVAGCDSVAVLTGAGISTESGLPDYRGTSGMWRNRRFEELASIRAFTEEPVAFWEFYRMRLAHLRDATPNRGHRALAALERAGHTQPVITQNVDGLHSAAGSDPVEVHGSLTRAECLACGLVFSIEEAERRSAGSPEQVPECDCGAPLKPGVVLFGELLPADAVRRASAIVDTCQAMLVCGSTLAVSPVNGLAAQVAMSERPLAIVNMGATELDRLAEVRVAAALGPVLAGVAASLLGADWDHHDTPRR